MPSIAVARKYYPFYGRNQTLASQLRNSAFGFTGVHSEFECCICFAAISVTGHPPPLSVGLKPLFPFNSIMESDREGFIIQ
jgi:hypothetical protein